MKLVDRKRIFRSLSEKVQGLQGVKYIWLETSKIRNDKGSPQKLLLILCENDDLKELYLEPKYRCPEDKRQLLFPPNVEQNRKNRRNYACLILYYRK